MDTKDQAEARPRHYAGEPSPLRERGVLTPTNQANRIEETNGHGDPRSHQDRAIDHLRDRLSYHPPSPKQRERHQAVRDAALVLGTAIIRNCEHSRDTDRALEQLEDTLMKANKSITFGGG